MPNGRLTGYLNGGGGTNTQKYMGWASAYVNLRTGIASGIGTGITFSLFGGLSNIQNVIGATTVIYPFPLFPPGRFTLYQPIQRL
jgi:hypothetical protein